MAHGMFGEVHFQDWVLVFGRVDRAQHGLWLHHEPDVHPGNALRAACQGGRPAHRRLDLCGRLDRRDLRRRFHHAVSVLGNDGVFVGVPGLVPAPAGVAGGGLSLFAGACGGRIGAAGAGWCCNLAARKGIWAFDASRCAASDGGDLPDHGGVPFERGGAAAARVAAGCLRRGHVQRVGLPVRVHDQDGGVCACAAALPGWKSWCRWA